ncbi:uncharacterized protein LOC124285939 [Haliotis rubra]|uniref:uncharacterized protein LOC124285939 n=1 Tax=Haliotis rubra TaxID=36100 RepID=UPI001EE5584B|nr:uncharacterized protein LOC124285939 [Haliotis rubra]
MMPSGDDPDVDDMKDWVLHTSVGESHKLGIIRIPPFNDGLFQFLAIFSFSLFIGLFLVQANMAWQSYQMLQRLSRNRPVPDMVYQLYFDYLEWEIDPSKVDLKVNTSIFVH